VKTRTLTCEKCGATAKKLILGMCEPCYMNSYRQSGREFICQTCGSTFTRYDRKNKSTKYCSRECYYKSNEVVKWPPAPELARRIMASSYKDVAESLGISIWGVKSFMRKHKEELVEAGLWRERPRLTEEQIVQVRSLWLDSVPTGEISGRTGVSTTHIVSLCRDLPRGEINPNTKLTRYQATQIRASFLTGRTIKELSEMYGVSIGTIYDVIGGRTWNEKGARAA
jgi:hypothetical protein